MDTFDTWEKARVRDPSQFQTDFGSCKSLVEQKVKSVYQKGGPQDSIRKVKFAWDRCPVDDRKVVKFTMPR